MTVVDTSVLIDVLRGMQVALDVLRDARFHGLVHASEVTRLEVLAGMRPREEAATRALLGTLVWHPLDENVAETAGRLGQRWLPAYRSIDAADLAIAATAMILDTQPLTKNVKHFPMFPDLAAPY